ncbi:non-homologous end-joining DNA ligase [Actinophytocola sp.]|uniref:non-homologous end-joining DNA ligase n=1 Tax=Actinophytocola sp. TaxID=1872138 RepID=UPI002ED46DAA
MATGVIEFDVDGHTVRVSSPDKPYFKELGVTKSDVVRYFLAVGDGILGALRDRPTTLERWPGGVFEGAKLSTRADSRGDAFYQKRVPKGAPDFVETARITFPSGRPADEVCPTSLAVVVWAVNLGTLTFHPWPVRRPEVDHPDQLRIDLDPQPGTDFHDAARVGFALRELLASLGMEGFPKTSGGRGLHVYVPIEPRWTFVEARRAVIALGRELARRMPDDVTMSWWKEERGERVFIDFNQMARDRTIACAYSIRPTPRAQVSAPLSWDELDDVTPADFTVLTMPDRFAKVGDRHADVATKAFSLEPLLDMVARDEENGEGDMPYPPEYPKMAGEPKRVQPSRARPDTP